MGRLTRLISVCGAAAGVAGAACAQSVGPDVIVGDLHEMAYLGTVNGVLGYSVGTVSCNVGTAGVIWIENSPQHPVIAQNLYRLSGGRLEQIGASWVKHAYGAINDSHCAPCQPGGSWQMLGVGCSDPYNAALNSGQMRLGPRSDVNATTGAFPYPYTVGFQQTGDPVYKRIQVAAADVQTPGALYFAEGQYITADEAQAGNGRNNASYRRVTFAGSPPQPTLAEETARELPAIFAWRDHGLGVGVPDPGVTIGAAEYVEQGLSARFWVGAKVTALGGGVWRYEYAVFNLNSHRAGASLAVPLAGGVSVSNLSWRGGGGSHSGEPYSGAPWVMGVGAGRVEFACAETFAANPNGNAVRWGTMDNFRFDANVGPGVARVQIGLFRPGAAGEAGFASVELPAPGTGPCYANCDNSTAAPTLNVADFGCFLTRYAAGDAYANCDGSTAAPALNVGDFGCFLQRYAAGCP
ncbi:MAG: hypothetical protein WD749_13160 [Phycisphaerales bacterium]